MNTLAVRIKQARKRRGWSMRELAEKAGLSATAISKFERGLTNPTSTTLIKLSDALDYSLDFFLRPIIVKEITPAFRKRSRLPKKAQEKVIEDIRDWLERYLIAEELAPSEGALRFEFPRGFPRTASNFNEVEKAANDLRSVWDIGSDPLESVTHLLEDKGIKVGEIGADEGFDGCMFQATNDGTIPVIVTRKGIPGDRQRFNLAHELGHLVLNVKEDPSIGFLEEKACHRFAAAFLAPADTLKADLGSHRNKLSVEELSLLKRKYGLSIAALLYRAKDLDIISEATAKSKWILFSRMGWNKKEPGSQLPPEKRMRFRLLVEQALAEEIITKKRAAELYRKKLRD